MILSDLVYDHVWTMLFFSIRVRCGMMCPEFNRSFLDDVG